ncbi:receptor-like protein 7 [Macadamia integrifolia]|uniref:receptor-like protein 7 n=1 Tax=Macadamia integrifolia TaxID=60698 RepID=UPI001C4FEC69|nr:receptor-like protein 7 [Macadamia integrifolia]
MEETVTVFESFIQLSKYFGATTTPKFFLKSINFAGEIPKSICKLSGLQVFDASHNSLSGSIPECLGNIGTLTVLDVQGNRFHGMPQYFTNASSLRTLKMNGNILEGQVPKSLANCSSLEVLDLGKNKMFDTFPFWLGKLPMLRVLALHYNRFYGPIKHPPTLDEFPMLQILDLSSNTFTENFPVEYFQSFKAMMFKKGNKSEAQYFGNSYYRDSVTIMNKGLEMELVRILTIYTALDLSNNSFQGEIPKVIGDLTSLVILNMSQNDLVGQIPTSIGNMADLESLDFSRNKLSGQIPWQVANLTFLEFLNLSQNHLEGPIPRGNQLDTFLNTSYIENPRLCGFPLSRKCKDNSDDMPPQGPQGERSTNDSQFDWKFMLMGYGCGMQESFINSTNSWEPEKDCCSCGGVTCNFTTGYVIDLDLSGYVIGFHYSSYYVIDSKVSGPIYSNSSLFSLHHLQRLNLAFNDFKLTPLPSGFDRLPILTHLNLSHSNFSGQVPWKFSRLTRLVSLDLSTFNFDENYYFNICSRILKLEKPNLKALIQNLTSLVELNLNGVDHSSPSPKHGRSSHWSQVLLQSLPNLRELSLSGCRLSGPNHTSFSQLVFLEELRLDGNYKLSLEAPNLLPLNFSYLKTLSLSYCGLYGEFPISVFQLPNLKFLDVSFNSLINGQLSDFPFNNSFQFILLSGTNFSGAIRDSIGNFRFLTTLRLDNGTLPKSPILPKLAVELFIVALKRTVKTCLCPLAMKNFAIVIEGKFKSVPFMSEIPQLWPAGARIGCSISASNKCKPPWWRSLFGGATVDVAACEHCEELEMASCLAVSKESCHKLGKEKCLPPFPDARIALIDCKEV